MTERPRDKRMTEQEALEFARRMKALQDKVRGVVDLDTGRASGVLKSCIKGKGTGGQGPRN